MISGIKYLQFVYKFLLEKFTICVICPKTGRVVRARPGKKEKWLLPLFLTDFSIMGENPHLLELQPYSRFTFVTFLR